MARRTEQNISRSLDNFDRLEVLWKESRTVSESMMDHDDEDEGSAALPRGIILLDVGWEEIKIAGIDKVQQILDEKTKTGQATSELTFPREEAVEIYTKVFMMCHQVEPYNWSEELFDRHGEAVAQYVAKVVAPAIHQLAQTPSSSQQQQQQPPPPQQQQQQTQQQQKDDNDDNIQEEMQFLRGLQAEWQNFLFFNRWMTNFFRILDRVHTEPLALPPIGKVALMHFRTAVFVPLESKMTSAILKLIRWERGGKISTSSTTTSTFGGGHNDDDNDNDYYNLHDLESLVMDTAAIYKTLDWDDATGYVAQLREDVLTSTRLYYSGKRHDWRYLDSNDYYEKAQAAIDSESLRTSEYLHKLVKPESELYDVLLEELLDKAPVPPPEEIMGDSSGGGHHSSGSSSCVKYVPVVGMFSSCGKNSRRGSKHQSSVSSLRQQLTGADAASSSSQQDGIQQESAPPPPPSSDRQRSPRGKAKKEKKRASSVASRRTRKNEDDYDEEGEEGGETPRRRFSFGSGSIASVADSFSKKQKAMKKKAKKKKKEKERQLLLQQQQQQQQSASPEAANTALTALSATSNNSNSTNHHEDLLDSTATLTARSNQ